MSGNGGVTLRAEAPDFIPSSSPSESVELLTQQAVVDDSGRPCRHRKNQRNRRRQHHSPKRTYKARGRVDSEKETREKRNEKKYVSAGSTTELGQRQRRKNGKSRRDSRHNDARLNQQADAIMEIGCNWESEAASPLKEDLSFPPLGNSIPSERESTSTWFDSNVKSKIVSNLQSSKEPSGEILDEFAALGLQKLSAYGSRPRQQKSNMYSTWDMETTTSQHQRDPVHCDETLELEENGQTEQLLPDVSVQQRRPQWNMTKLRDKWWDAISKQKTRKNMMAELQKVLVDRIVDPTVEEVSCVKLETDEFSAVHEVLESNVIASEPSASQTLTDRHSNKQDQIMGQFLRETEGASLMELLDGWITTPDQDNRHHNLFLERTTKILVHAVESDLQQLLNIALDHLNTNEPSRVAEKDSRYSDLSTEVGKAFLLAAELGSEGCVSTFLTRWNNTSSLYAFRDNDGNSVFHRCCGGQGSPAVLHALLRHLSGGTKSKQQQLAKVLSAKNKFSQTALHIACEKGRVNYVETFLSVCSTALLAKLLAMEDDRTQTPLLAAVGADSTDVVMCLIMWRGNRNLILRTTPQAPRKIVGNGLGGRFAPSDLQAPSCPMVWAANKGNLAMIQLLLSDPSGQDFRITESITALLQSNATTDIKVDGARLLVHEGGNPFENFADETAVSIAAKYCDTAVLHSLVTSGLQQLRDRQQERRKDPKLRQQPESFFKTIECKEDFEKDRALANALVESLYLGWSYSPQETRELSKPLAAAVCLYMLGVTLQGKDKARLHVSMRVHHFQPTSVFVEEPNEYCYVASYFRQVNRSCKQHKVSDLDRSALSLHSNLLLKMDWFREQHHRSSFRCSWLADNQVVGSFDDWEKWRDEEVLLIAVDGTCFTVHDSIVSSKSAKLASAIRFANMKNTNVTSPTKKVIDLDISSQLCGWMLQHIYHGSIAFEWSRGEPTCQDILELMVVAEEFLCFSLLQECEMRLLHSNPSTCFCWSCAKSVKTHSEELVECLYFASGPSLLLNGSSALDVLAVLEHLGNDADFHYNILQVARSAAWFKCAVPSKIWNHDDENYWSLHAATTSLKACVNYIILSSFADVVNSESFQASAIQTEGGHDKEGKRLNDPREEISHRILLLQMCLEELSVLELPKAYERYQQYLKISTFERPVRAACVSPGSL